MADFGSLDYRPLTAAVGPARLREFRRRLGTVSLGDPVPPPDPNARVSSRRFSSGDIVVLVLFGVAFLVLGAILGGTFGTSFASSAAASAPLAFGGGELLGFAASAVAMAVIYAGTVLRARFVALRRYRLDAFARTNGLRVVFENDGPDYPGAIFHVGHDRRAVDCLRTASGAFTEIGSYRYTTGNGKNRQDHHWGYLAIGLGDPLPHMVLDARANNGLFGATNLPTTFARDQVLHLEGDFDRFFTLYCPSDYEQDALYVFTPDLMALLIDEASAYDVEIIDRWLFVYSSESFDTADPALVRRLFRIVSTVGAKTESRAERYRDDRSPAAPNAIAPTVSGSADAPAHSIASGTASASQSSGGASSAVHPSAYPPPRRIASAGRRLRPGVNVGAFIVVVLALVAWALFTVMR